MIFQADTLARQRQLGSVTIVGLNWILCAATAVSTFGLGTAPLTTTIAALTISLAQLAVWKIAGDGATGRTVAAVLLMAQVSVLVASAAGHPWQIDLHMVYFAALAVLIVHCDWRAILIGAATVAVHHLVLSFVLPDMVFPDSASLTRVVLHAVILIVEAAVLMWSAASVSMMFSANVESRKAADAATGEALAAVHDAEAARAENDRQTASAAERDRDAAREQAEVVAQTAAGLSALADGMLGYRIPGRFPEAYAKLQNDFNSAMTSLQQAMGEIGGNVSGIADEAGQISAAADNLSRRTEHQAATLEETAAALDEVAAAVKLAAAGADQASTAMSRAEAEAEASRPVVTDAISAMDEIESSSEQISQIIGMIDEIAFQTNLLALNAGVEAARAGDAGRGFAVVASEVRALAQRSADAARDIKALISTSRDQVRNGVVLVGRTGSALTAISARVSEIGGFVGQIAASTREQATALTEINNAVADMDHATQQNAAMVEQSTAACEALTRDAARLAALVGRFRVENTARERALAA
jgi:methyl-accepting chemotaxis protein